MQRDLKSKQVKKGISSF